MALNHFVFLYFCDLFVQLLFSTEYMNHTCVFIIVCFVQICEMIMITVVVTKPIYLNHVELNE